MRLNLLQSCQNFTGRLRGSLPQHSWEAPINIHPEQKCCFLVVDGRSTRVPPTTNCYPHSFGREPVASFLLHLSLLHLKELCLGYMRPPKLSFSLSSLNGQNFGELSPRGAASNSFASPRLWANLWMAKLLYLHGWYNPACSQRWLQARALRLSEDPVSVTFFRTLSAKVCFDVWQLGPGTPRGLVWPGRRAGRTKHKL